jgi:hypothetical protein
MIDQISVFLENEVGRLSAFSGTLEENNINLKAICIADTADFGILRCIVDNPQAAVEALKNKGFTASITKVLGISVPDGPGGLHQVLDFLTKEGISVDYIYSLVRSADGQAELILKVDDPENAAKGLVAKGIQVLTATDI